MRAFWAEPEFWLWLAAFLAFLNLSIRYGFGSPWHDSAIGRSLLPMKVALTLLFAWVLSIFVFGHYPYSDLLRVLALGFVTVMGVWQSIVWRRVQLGDRRNPSCPKRRATDL